MNPVSKQVNRVNLLSILLIVIFFCLTTTLNAEILAQYEAEGCQSLPNSGWEIVTNDGETALLSLQSNILGPPDEYRLDFPFTVPDGVSEVYVFAEIDVNRSNNDDSFWVTMNRTSTCNWNNLSPLGDGWKRSWIYNYGKDSQHAFPVNAGTVNSLNFYPRENGAHLNWIVISTDPNVDISNFSFTGSAPPSTDSPVISLSPTELYFTGEAGQSNLPAQAITVNNSGLGVLHWQAQEVPNANWLAIDKTIGGSGEQITVTPNITGMVAGTYQTTIEIWDDDAENSPQVVPVTLTITSETPTLRVSPDVVAFMVTAGSDNPADQLVRVSNTGGGTLHWTATEEPDAAWLTLTNTTGNNDDDVTLSVDINGLDIGLHSAIVRISDPNSSNQYLDIPVTLTLQLGEEGSVIAEIEAELSPSLPNDAWEITNNDGKNCLYVKTSAAAGPAEDYRLDYPFIVPEGVNTVYIFGEVDVNGSQNDDSFFIGMNNSDFCNWGPMANVGDGWNRRWVFNYGKDTQHAFAVQPGVNILNLFPRENGAYINWLVVTADPNMRYQLHSFTPSWTPPTHAPLLVPSPIDLSFEGTVGQPNPAAQTLLIGDYGDGTLNWSAATDAAWLTLSKSSGYADESISVSVNLTGLTAGEYSTNIRLTDPSASNSPVDVPVTLTVIGVDPQIEANVNNLYFRAIAGGTSPSNKKILVTNAAGGTLNWTAQEYPETSWMSLSNTSGGSGEEITVSVNISGLSGGAYHSTIRITDPNAINDPVDIPVTLSMGPNIVVTTEDFGGNGSDAEPFIIHQQTMQFHVDLTEEQKEEDVKYWVQVHMASYRSCTIQYQEKDLTWQQLEDRLFEYTADMTGWYYLRVDVERDGVYDEEARTHVYVETPPLKPYTLPYTPPSWNVLPQPACEIVNAVSGTGEYTDPYKLDSPIMQFRIDGTTDPNGEDDLRYGAFLWAIHMHGGLHPVYAKDQNEPLARNTFLYYDDMKGTIYDWDVRERPSTTDYYIVYVPVIDQWGQVNITSKHIKYDTPYEKEVAIISPSATQVNFTATEGGANPAHQFVTISNAGPSILGWKATDITNQSWLSLPQYVGSNDHQLELAVNTTGLSVGTYQATVQIYDQFAANKTVDIPVTLTITDGSGEPTADDDILAQLEAEGAAALPNSGWLITTNENETCLQSLVNDIMSPPAEYRLDYTFFVPDGITTVYLFAEVDVNADGNDDSFWVQVNGSNTCTWNNLRGIGDGWKRAWVYNQGRDTQHAFPVSPGINTISFYPRENGAFLNWLVVTANSQQDIQNFTFTGVTPPPVETPVLTVSPTALIFNGEPDGANPASQLLIVQNTGTGTMAWTAAEQPDAAWLTLTNTAGGNVGQITAAVNISGMTAGSYTTEIILSSNEAANSPVSVPVQLVLAGSEPVITLSPATVAFSGVEGGTNPAVQQVTISNSGTGTLSWNAAKTETADWLTLTNTSGSAGEKVSLQANITGLSAATYQTTVNITAAGAANTPQSLPITLVVEAQNTNTSILAELEAEQSADLPNSGWETLVNDDENCIKALINSITAPPDAYRIDYVFNVPTGTSTVYIFGEVDVNNDGNDDSFWVQVNGGQTCNWNNLRTLGDGWKRSWVYNQGKDTQHAFTVNAGQNTISFYPRENGAQLNWLVVTTDKDLKPGEYDFSGSTPIVPTTPVLAVSPTAMTFSTVLGAVTPMSKVLTIQNTGAGTMDWTAVEVPENSWLTLSATSGTNNGTLNVICDPSGLTTGSYDATVRISAPAASNSSIDVSVSMAINNQIPVIAVTPASLTFNTTVDGPSPAGQGLTITNTGEGSLNWTATENPENVWLSLSNTSGTDGEQVMVSVNAVGLPAGSYSGAVRITDAAASNNPLDVPVTFTIVEDQPNTAILAEFQAEDCGSLPNSGWSEVIVDNQTGIQAEVNDISAPPVPYQLDFGFCVPEGVTTVYVFADINNNHSINDDSFWITLNGGQKCNWNGTALSNTWVRSWVYNQFKNKQQAFAVSAGDNVLNIYPRENGAKINWLVVTSDPNLDIENYTYGSGMSKNPICCQDENPIIPERFHLMQNYPNPFNPETTISFSMPEFGHVKLVIYNTLGQEVIQLFNASLAAGNYQLHWNGRNAKGHLVSSGLYMCQMKAGSFEQTIRMQLVQ